MEDAEQGDIIDTQRYRAVIAEIDKTLEGIRERRERASIEQDMLIKRVGELDKVREGLDRQYDKLLTQKAFWVDEMAKGPPLPPDEPLGDAVDRMIEEDPTRTTDQLIGMLDPAYFQEGVTSNWKRKVSMHRRWALERRGLWKNSHEHNESGDSETDDPASGGTG